MRHGGRDGKTSTRFEQSQVSRAASYAPGDISDLIRRAEQEAAERARKVAQT